jgi:hypothetical protein
VLSFTIIQGKLHKQWGDGMIRKWRQHNFG